MKIISSNNYNSAKKEFSINSVDLFGASLSNKKGAIIIIESQKGIKFGAFFTAKIDFITGKVESYSDNQVVLFNITNERVFPMQNQKTKIHTSTRLLGLHPKIYFDEKVPNLKDRSMKFDLSINRRTIVEGPKVVSCTNLPGFKIDSTNGINSLTGEATERVNISRIDIWSLN